MKKIINISLLLMVLCLNVSVFADGEMETGNRTCTSNCLIVGQTETPSDKTDEIKSESFILGVYTWLNKTMFEIFD
jgi:hypothetical protein